MLKQTFIIATLFFTHTILYSQSVLDSNRWKLTLPIASSKGNALEVLNPDFSNLFKGESKTTNDFKEYVQFSEEGITFHCEYTGVTTSSNTKYSRTELRQMMGSDECNWKLDEKSKLSCRLKVSDLKGGANKLFVMQIHGKAPKSKPLIKIIWEKGYIRILAKGGPKLKDIKREKNYTNVGIDTWFTCSIHASKGLLEVYVNDEKIETFESDVLSYWPKENTYYFKAGNYLQHDIKGASASVTFSSITLD